MSLKYSEFPGGEREGEGPLWWSSSSPEGSVKDE